MELNHALTLRLREYMGNHESAPQLLGPDWRAVSGGAAAARGPRVASSGNEHLLMRGVAEVLHRQSGDRAFMEQQAMLMQQLLAQTENLVQMQRDTHGLVQGLMDKFNAWSDFSEQGEFS